MANILRGKELAKAVAKWYSFLGKVWAHYEGGGWITIRGENLPSRPSLRKMYPNGWCLLDRMRCGAARKKIAQKAPRRPKWVR